MKINVIHNYNKKRLGIFVFFNKDGIVEENINFLLKEMRTLLDRLLIVVNGYVIPEGKKIFEEYTNEIYIRENRGYDGGAYKDVFLNYLKNEEWKEFEEIVLFNDTFYGPFIPMKSIFQKMGKEEIDFWGLSRWPEAKVGIVNGIKKLPTHIQSYFLVINERMLSAKAFVDFWIQMEYPKTYEDAIESFEISFTQHFAQEGFKYKSWIDYWNENMCGSDKLDTCNSIQHLYDMEFPIAKKKAVCLLSDDKMQQFKEYLSKVEKFPTEQVEKERIKMQKRGIGLPFVLDKLNEFLVSKEKIYIYGNGYCKNIVLPYLELNDYRVDGIVVTKRKENEIGILEFSELCLNEDDGIIVALGYDNACDIKKFLKDKVKEEQILYPQYVESF